MAGPLTITTSLLTILMAAVQSAKSLQETVNRYGGRDRSLQRLRNEIQDLTKVLESLTKATDTEESLLEPLRGPVKQCSKICDDFKLSMEVFSSKSKTGFRDWARMKFMGGNIDEFSDTIAQYKSTISVGLGTITMHNSNVSHHVLSEMINDATNSLEFYLQRIDEKMTQLTTEHGNTLGVSVDLEDERDVTGQCIRIRDEARSNPQNILARLSHLLDEAPERSTQENLFGAQVQARQTLVERQDRFAQTASHLSQRLHSLLQDPIPDNKEQILWLQSELEVLMQCSNICNMASEITHQEVHPVRTAFSDEANHTLLQSSQSGAVATQMEAPIWRSGYSSVMKGEENTDNNANRSNSGAEHGPSLSSHFSQMSTEILQHLTNASTKMDMQPKITPPNADTSEQESFLSFDSAAVDSVLPEPEYDSCDTESIFSSGSIASSVTSVGINFLTDEVVHKVVDALFCTEELSIVHQSAIEDSAIGVARFTRNVRRMVSNFGRAMKIEFPDSELSVFAKVLQSRNLSDRAARRIAQRNNGEVSVPVHLAHSIDEGFTRARRTERSERMFSDTKHDDSSDASTDSSADEQLEEDPRIEELYTASETLRSSQAFQAFKVRLLDFAHSPYENRIHRIIEEAFGTEERLPKDVIRSLSRELSWVPTQLFTFCKNRKLGILNNLKACIFHKSDIEYWQWWPSPMEWRRIRECDIRLSWHTPCGNPRSIDLPKRLVLPLQEVFTTAPRFQETYQPMHTISHTAKILHMMASSFGMANINPSNGNVSPAQPPSGSLRQGHNLSTIPSQSQPSASANAAILFSNRQSNSNRSASDGHIYLCIKSGRRYQFTTLEAHSLMTDVRLFSRIKKEYLLARKGFLHWFSIWRYSHCDFFQFSRFAMGAAPLGEGFPSASDIEYDFQPRPISPQPPFGPISKLEFRERFYTYCEDCCHRWHQQQMKRWYPVFQNADAMKLMPKRKTALEMQDGKRDLFWGLLVREERHDEIVLLYAFLVNLPGIIFFFLWLFDWGHASDLQNASVPFLTSLSLTVGFVGWLFHSSKDDV